MRTGTITIKENRDLDRFALGVIDRTHFFLKPYEGHKAPTVEEIRDGHVYHVAQLKNLAEGLYEALDEWLAGQRELRNAIFKMEC
jgi:hypothetical protein